MSRSLNELLTKVQVLEPVVHLGLQVFGLRWPSESGLRYGTLDEAMAAGTLEVTEISEAGSVPLLKVSNRSEEMAFLMAGEHLVGAKQNRFLNVSLMVPPSSSLFVPVSCVEAGRWHRRSTGFASGGSLSHGTLRRMVSEQTQAGYQAGGTPTSDQGAIWNEVSRKLGAMGSHSPSRALEQVYQDHAARLDELVVRLHPSADCHGVVFVVAGRIAGADLFDQPATLAKLWTKLVRASAIDALESPAVATPLAGAQVASWLRTAAGAPVESYPSPGLGQDLRLRSPDVVGSALVVEDQAVHVELFANPTPSGT